jgi:15-cis-phytoene synthase
VRQCMYGSACTAVRETKHLVFSGPGIIFHQTTGQNVGRSMKNREMHYRTFRSGSRTYFNSSLFFPAAVKQDVFTLYSFVRTADNFVDAIPQDREGFKRFRETYRSVLSSRNGDERNPDETGIDEKRTTRGNECADRGRNTERSEIADNRDALREEEIIIRSFVSLSIEKNFEAEWTEAFFRSMEWDTERTTYHTLNETLAYIYGSAEVIGLYMARIMGLPSEADHPARMLGRAMQYINFIRDIDEDNRLGRTYLPLSETTLSSLDPSETGSDPEEFRRFVTAQIDRYRKWYAQAQEGFAYIQGRSRIAVETASAMYAWTADVIANDPFVVYRKKVKPAKGRVIFHAILRTLGTGRFSDHETTHST